MAQTYTGYIGAVRVDARFGEQSCSCDCSFGREAFAHVCVPMGVAREKQLEAVQRPLERIFSGDGAYRPDGFANAILDFVEKHRR